jgi:hypothetical protein
MLKRLQNYFWLGLIFMALGCAGRMDYKELNKDVTCFPDYQNIAIPANIAPLNFLIQDKADGYKVVLKGVAKSEITVNSANGRIIFPKSKWKAFLSENRGKDIVLDFYLKQHGNWMKYKSATNYVATDNIDPYLVYRLIEPGYETWNKMGIYQRNLENFDESPVMINNLSDGNCMNCHSFCRNSGNHMLFHMRAQNGGTYILKDGTVSKVDTKTDSTLSAGVYPAWHPGGRFVAFSVNRIVQSFHAIEQRTIEVIDTLSDLMIYDTKLNKVLTSASVASPSRYETFPVWASDGKSLYFCSADFQHYRNFENIKYDLLKINFDTTAVKFGAVDTIIAAARQGFSVSFPRISPDGKTLMFCKTAYGNFTIWHDDSDIYALDLQTMQMYKPEINSNRSESYHNWSSSGRWMVFSSRRIDGLYTRPYFTYIDKDGKAHKPFLLPQKDPEFYLDFIKSYNVPELVTSKVNLDPRTLEKIAKKEAVKSSFERIF